MNKNKQTRTPENCLSCLTKTKLKTLGKTTKKQRNQIIKELSESAKLDCQKYPWTIMAQLGQTQALCDDKTNTENLTDEPATQTEPQWVS
jgi:hypothetical protein